MKRTRKYDDGAISVREKTRRHKRHVKSAGETRTTYVRSSAEETDGRTRRGARDGRKLALAYRYAKRPKRRQRETGTRIDESVREQRKRQVAEETYAKRRKRRAKGNC